MQYALELFGCANNYEINNLAGLGECL